MATPKITYTFGTGRRKTSVARVRVREGNGRIVINSREMPEYFTLQPEQHKVLSPLRLLDCEKKFDIFIRAEGGGLTSQAGAISLGISRALLKLNPDYE